MPMTSPEHLREHLRRDIADGVFPAGAKLVERQLCERYNSGRTAVRDALRFLAAEEIVELSENRGATVSQVRYEQALDVYQVREVLEGLAGELFAVRGSPAAKRAFADSLAEVRAAFDEGDERRVLLANEQFYDHLLHGSGNAELKRTINRLHVRINQLRRISLASPNRSASTLDELQAMVNAVVAANPTAARDACILHVRAAATAALPRLMATGDLALVG